MSLQITGKVKAVFDTQTFGSGFTKREFVITTDETYPQDVKFELVKEKCSMADKWKTGQQLTVHFNIRGNEHLGKYYVSLQAWKIEASAPPQNQSAPPQNVSAPPRAVSAPPAEEDTDLPF